MSWPAVYHGLPLAALPAKDRMARSLPAGKSRSRIWCWRAGLGPHAQMRQVRKPDLDPPARRNLRRGFSVDRRSARRTRAERRIQMRSRQQWRIACSTRNRVDASSCLAVNYNGVVRESAQPGARSGSQLTRAVFHQSWACLSSPGTSVPVALPGQQPQLRSWSVTDAGRDHSMTAVWGCISQPPDLLYWPEYKRGHMRFTLAIFCMFACGTSAMAQYGVSNARDGNGNLIRNTGMNPARGFSQGPANYLGPSNNLNGPITNAPGPTPPAKARTNSGAIR